MLKMNIEGIDARALKDELTRFNSAAKNMKQDYPQLYDLLQAVRKAEQHPDLLSDSRAIVLDGKDNLVHTIPIKHANIYATATLDSK